MTAQIQGNSGALIHPQLMQLDVAPQVELEQDWKRVLMAYIMRVPNVLGRSIGCLDKDSMRREFGPTCALLWEIACTYFSAFTVCPPFNVVLGELTRAIEQGKLPIDQQQMLELSDYLQWVYSTPQNELVDHYGLTLLQRIAHVVHVERPISAALASGVAGTEIALIAERGTAKSTFTTAAVVTADEVLSAVQDSAMPIPLGTPAIAYANELLCGGVLPGEEHVLIGPTGGYKTTMAIDIAASMAESGQPVAFLGYEQSKKAGNLAIRMLSRLSGVPVSMVREFSGIAPKRLPTEEEREKIYMAMKAETAPWHNLMWLDRSANADSIADISSLVQYMPKKPVLIIIDQLLTWLMQVMSSEDQDKMATKGRDMLGMLKKQVFEKYGVAGLVLHQLTAAENASSPNKKFTHADSAGIKGIAFWVDGVTNMHHYDPDSDTLLLRSTKNRRGQNLKEVFVRPVPDLGRLILKTGVTYSERDGRIIAPGEQNRIPHA